MGCLASGTLLEEFTYDAWGNFTSSLDTVHSIPTGEQLAAVGTGFRYRGYYYDTETGLYYLNARYYDPAIHRFVNRDDLSCLGATGDFNSYNLYAYCGNNPVMFVDPMGTTLQSALEKAHEFRVQSIQGEFGMGRGLGLMVDKNGLEFRYSNALFFENGELMAGNQLSLGGSVGGIGYNFSKTQYTSSESGYGEYIHGSHIESKYFDQVIEAFNCEQCKKTHEIQLAFINIEITDGKVSTSASVGGAIHALIGFNFNIGFDGLGFEYFFWKEVFSK